MSNWEQEVAQAKSAIYAHGINFAAENCDEATVAQALSDLSEEWDDIVVDGLLADG